MKRKKSEKPNLKNQTLNCLFEPETRTWEQPDLRGQTFGRLSVEEPADRRNPQIVIWRCVCECGRIVCISAPRLVNGYAKSCGICGFERFIKNKKEARLR